MLTAKGIMRLDRALIVEKLFLGLLSLTPLIAFSFIIAFILIMAIGRL